MALDRPVIIFGTGRGGTSVFHTLMSQHPHVAWLTRLVDRSPARPGRGAWVMRALDVPGLERVVRSKYPPIEGYRFWAFHCPGFTTSTRDLHADDVTQRNRARLRAALSAVPTTRRSRLLLKITGWPRLSFLKEVFPDAKFIHVKRDGRAVANSLMNVGFWRGWQGPGQWRWGGLTERQQREWEAHDRSYVALAGIQWKIHMNAVVEARRLIDADDVHEIAYEDLCADPIAVCRGVLESCGLDGAPGFERTVRNSPLENTNDKWRSDLTESQQAVLNDVLSEDLRRHGYEPGGKDGDARG